MQTESERETQTETMTGKTQAETMTGKKRGKETHGEEQIDTAK